MNKVKNFLLLAMIAASSATFVSCEKDNDDNGVPPRPTLALVSPENNVTVAPNSTVTVNVLAAAPSGEKLKTFRVEFSANGAPYTAYSNAFPNGRNDTTFNESNFNYIKSLPTLSSPGTITYKFYATDDENQTGTLEFKINVVAGASDISTYTAKIMGNQNSSLGSFLATATGAVYTQSQAKTNSSAVDVLYYHGAANGPTLAAPDDAAAATIYDNSSTGLQTWSVRNATRFAKLALLDEADFNQTDNSSEIATNTTQVTLTPSSSTTQLAAGNVIGFVTAAGKRGMILVKSITGSNTASGSITVDVKVQK